MSSDTPENKGQGLVSFLSRTPFTVLGAIGLFSLVSDFLAVQEDLARWVEAWKAVTRPIWDTLLGWMFEWLGIGFPWWVKDYLTLGLILFGMVLRLEYYVGKRKQNLDKFEFYFITPIFIGPIVIVFWPIFLFTQFRGYHLKSSVYYDSEVSTEEKYVFWETSIYFVVLIALNYALIFGRSTVA